jgi:hypothetical protein
LGRNRTSLLIEHDPSGQVPKGMLFRIMLWRLRHGGLSLCDPQRWFGAHDSMSRHGSVLGSVLQPPLPFSIVSLMNDVWRSAIMPNEPVSRNSVIDCQFAADASCARHMNSETHKWN